MDLKHIKKLINLVEESQISALSLDEDNVKIEIKKELPQVQQMIVSPQVAPAQSQVTSEETPSTPKKDPNLVSITSPMVGTFYLASNPNDPPLINKGDKISTGQVICIVEAMKLFNEIESEISGTVEEILVENSQPVEYGQELFLVRVG